MREHSGGFWPRDIASRSSLSRFNDREFALTKDLIISTCFSKDDKLGVTLLRSSAWQSDPVYTPPMKTPAPAFARVTRRGSITSKNNMGDRTALNKQPSATG